jgi:hypothetical protein
MIIAYRLWFSFKPALTGIYQIDGILGVCLGLYTCARAVAHLLDLLFQYRYDLGQIIANWPNRSWLAVNLLVLFLGFGIIFFSLSHFLY